MKTKEGTELKCCARLIVVAYVAGLAWSAQGELPEKELRPVLQGVDLADRKEEARISVMAELGQTIPKILLLQLGSSSEVTLKITEGNADFLYSDSGTEDFDRVKEVRYQAKELWLPPIYVGTEEKESTVEVTVDGQGLASTLRIGALQPGLIADLWRWMKSAQPAILYLDPENRFVVADLTKIAYEELPGDVEEYQQRLERGEAPEYESQQQIDLPSDPQSSLWGEKFGRRESIYEDGDAEARCPTLVWLKPKPTDNFPVNSCSLNLRPYARVEFPGVPDPAGRGYSVKPESQDGVLAPAVAPAMNHIDGLYRRSWGCGIALKIPNNVLVRVFETDASCCRGLAARLAGVGCSWLATGAHDDWPNCPL